jgi:hypothetical protein
MADVHDDDLRTALARRVDEREEERIRLALRTWTERRRFKRNLQHDEQRCDSEACWYSLMAYPA